jgi:MerR family transcriptional regulator, copper efflux regulator
MKSSPSSTADTQTTEEPELAIGQLAARFGLASHVLRHWEAVGVIEPAERVNGRRRYREWHLARVAMIIRLKEAGLSLDQIRAVLDAPDGQTRKRLLREHRDELERRIAAMAASKDMVEHGIACQAEDFTQCPNFLRMVDELVAAGRPGPDDRRARGIAR